MTTELDKKLFEHANEVSVEFQNKILKRITTYINKYNQAAQLPIQFIRVIAMMMLSFLENTKSHFTKHEDYIKFKQSFFKLLEEEIFMLGKTIEKQNAEQCKTPQVH
jgi:hypothetical protein